MVWGEKEPDRWGRRKGQRCGASISTELEEIKIQISAGLL